MPPDRNLERDLGELGGQIDYPPTPDLAQTVRVRLEETYEPPPRRGWFPQWWAAAAAVLLLLAVPVLSPEVRDAATGWFVAEQAGGGQASTGEQAAGGAEEGASSVGQEPTLMDQEGDSRARASQAGGGQPMPGSADGGRPSKGDPRYGETVPLREVPGRLAGNEPLLPDLGAPDEVYARGVSRKDGVVLVYRAERGLPTSGGTETELVLTEVPGSVEMAYLRGRTLGARGAEEVSVGGGPGYWVPAGRRPSIAERAGELPGNVLFWEREGLALRLEADLPKREMVRIAESVR